MSYDDFGDERREKLNFKRYLDEMNAPDDSFGDEDFIGPKNIFEHEEAGTIEIGFGYNASEGHVVITKTLAEEIDKMDLGQEEEFYFPDETKKWRLTKESSDIVSFEGILTGPSGRVYISDLTKFL